MTCKFQEKTLQEWLDILSNCGIPHGPINNISQILNDIHVKDRNLIHQIQHPTAKSIQLIANPIQYSVNTDIHDQVRLSPPYLGQHTHQILKTILGYDDYFIKQLQQNNVI